jgi:predicted ThiF/HesA family dinucleotide-utilizing enzyme
MNNKTVKRHNNKPVYFFTNSELFVILEKIIAETGETKAEFFNRLLENEHAKLTGDFAKIKSNMEYITHAKIDELQSTVNRLYLKTNNLEKKLEEKIDCVHKQMNTNRDFIAKKTDFGASISMMALKTAYKLFYFFLRFFVEKEKITRDELKKRGDVVNRLSKETFTVKINELRNSFNDGNLDVAEKYIQQEE